MNPDIFHVPDLDLFGETEDGAASFIEITSRKELGADGRFFEPGDLVVLNPGGGNQETAIVAAADLASLWLAEALQYDHESGEMLAWTGISDASALLPALSIALDDDPALLELAWPAAFADFTIEATANLGSPATWTPATPLSLGEQDGNLVARIERPDETRFFSALRAIRFFLDAVPQLACGLMKHSVARLKPTSTPFLFALRSPSCLSFAPSVNKQMPAYFGCWFLILLQSASLTLTGQPQHPEEGNLPSLRSQSVDSVKYEILDLGNLGGEDGCWPTAVNDNGQVVGYSVNQVGTTRAFIWNEGTGIQDLGAIGSPPGGDLTVSKAWGINNKGQVVGSSGGYDLAVDVPVQEGEEPRVEHFSITRAILWENGDLTDLGLTPVFAEESPYLSIGEAHTELRAINDKGFAVGFGRNLERLNSVDIQFSLEFAATWSSGFWTGVASSYTTSWLTDVNENNVAVGWRHRLSIQQAVEWSGGSLQELNPFNAFASRANAINNAGDIVGMYDSHAFAILNGRIEGLDSWGDTKFSEAYDINDSQQIIGDGDGVAVVWEKGGMTRVDSLIPEGSDWVFISVATAINNQGWIVGRGTRQIEGEYYHGGFLLRPILEPISIDVPKASFEKGEKFNTTVTVRSKGEETQSFAFSEPLLSTRGEGLLEIGFVELPEPFELGPADPVREFIVPIVATNPGLTEISSTISITDQGGGTTMKTAVKPVVVAPFDVSVITTPRELVLNQTSAGPGCEGLTHEDGTAVANCIEITATITNVTQQTIENVTIPGATNVLSLMTSRDPEEPGVPLTPIDFFPPAGTPDAPLPFTLEPGEGSTFTWHVEAYDAPADLEVEALALGSIEDHNVQGLGQSRLKLIDEPLLEWGIRPQNGKTQYLSGQLARVEGFIKNVSQESGKGRTLRVMVYQLPEGNLGDGFMFETGTREGSSTPDYYQIFDLPPEGDRSELNLTGLFRSFPTYEPSEGVVHYDVRLWVVEDDGAVTSADDQALLDEAWEDKFTVHFAADPPPPDTFRDECRDAGVPAWLCGLSHGIYFDFTGGIWGLLQFAGQGFVELKNVGVQVQVFNLWAVKEMWRALQGDEAAKAALAQELYVEYQTFVELGVMAGDAGSQVPMAFEAFSVQFSSSLGHFFQAVDDGDVEEVQFQVGEFFGANPDLLIEPFMVARGYQKMANAVRLAGEELGDNVLLAAERQQAARQAESLESRLAAAEADPNVVDLATALKAGDELSDDLLRRIYGLSSEQRKALQEFCQENGVIVAFRSRNPLALELLEANEAWPKPQALKWKTVNDIDVEFLGYRSEARAKIEIVEPPAGIAGKTGDELESALDSYMEVLEGKNPVLKENRVLASEVRGRLKTRAVEWNDLAPELNLKSAPSETEIGVNFEAGNQFTHDVGTQVGVKDTRTVYQTPVEGGVIDPVTGTSRRTWEIKMSGPGGAEARSVVGDIDFLAILEPNGGLIRDVNRQIKLYHQLAALMDMQHGESFTFRLQELRAKFLRCCTEGGQAMVTIGPDPRHPPTAGIFVDNLSVLDNSPNAKFLGPRPRLVDEGGELILKDGQPIEIRRPDPTGEFVLINGMPAAVSMDLEFFRRFIPLAYDQALKDFFKRAPFYLPSYLARLLGAGDQGGGQVQGNSFSSVSAQSNSTVEAVFSIDGPILQAGNLGVGNIGGGLTSLRVWTESDGWQTISAADALALGDAATADLAPMTSMPDGANAGASLIRITSQADLGAGGRFFDAGDFVVLNPGGDNQETAIVAAADLASLWLAEALQYDHESGEMLAWTGISDASGLLPALSIGLVDDPPMLEFVWPAAFADFTIESTTNLGTPNTWTPVTATSLTEQDGNLVARIERPDETLFFRLAQP